MSSTLDTVHYLMRGLVHRMGKADAAAKAVAQFLGHSREDAGDLSRKMAGSRNWTLVDLIALQAATGSHHVTDFLVSLKASDARDRPADMVALLQTVVTEFGDVQRVGLSRIREDDPETTARLHTEALELRAVLDEMIAATAPQASQATQAEVVPARRSA